MDKSLFKRTKMKDVNATVIVDLKPTKKEIFSNLHKDARWGIKRAIKENLKVVEGNEKDWSEFYGLYKKTMRLGGVEAESIEKLKKNTSVLFVCKKDEKIIAVAGIWFTDTYNKGIPRLYINASIKEYLKMQPNNILYWHCILWCKNKGYDKFDLGGWQINAKNHLIGINKFKEKWGEIVYFSSNYSFLKAIGRKLIRNSKVIRFIWDRIKKRPISKKDLNIENKKAYETKESIERYSSHDEEVFDSEKELIKKYFKGNILDLGCGCGRTTKFLFDKGYKVIGVEIVDEMINVAKKKFPKINFEVGDACKLNFPDEKFDVVFFSYNGLDYIFPEEKRILAIKEISRVLKQGGIFVYSSHNPLALLKKFRPMFLLRNLLKRSIFSRYKYEKQNFGYLCTYYASPKVQKELIEKNSSMKLIELYVDKKDKLHPNYVFKKNKNSS